MNTKTKRGKSTSRDKVLQSLITTIQQQGESMAVNFDKLETALAKNTDAVGSMKTLVTTLNDEIKRISAASSDPATQTKLDALASATDARTDDIIAATLAGTPADPAVVPPTSTEPPVI